MLESIRTKKVKGFVGENSELQEVDSFFAWYCIAVHSLVPSLLFAPAFCNSKLLACLPGLAKKAAITEFPCTSTVAFVMDQDNV